MNRHPSYADDDNDAAPRGLPLSPFRRVGDTIYVAGQGAVNERGEYTSSDFEGQFRDTMTNLQKVLASAGVGLADIVMVRGYVQNPADLPLYNRLYRDYFSEPFPARTTIVNCLPEGLLFEIDCVAAAVGAAHEDAS